MQMVQILEELQEPDYNANKIQHPNGNYAIRMSIDSIPTKIVPKGCCADHVPYDYTRDVDLESLILNIDDLNDFQEQKLIHIKGLNRSNPVLSRIDIVSKFQQNDISLKLENIVAKEVHFPLDAELTHLEIVNCRIDKIFLMSCPELLGKKGKHMVGYNDMKVQGLTGTTTTSSTGFYCLDEKNIPEKLLAHSRMLRSQPPVQLGRLKPGLPNDFVFPIDDWYNKALHERPLDMDLVERSMEPLPKSLKLTS